MQLTAKIGTQAAHHPLGFSHTYYVIAGNTPVLVHNCDIVPGGGLKGHEGVDGGHAIERHVGKSDAFLRGRLASSARMRSASTFTNRHAAETGTSANIRNSHALIDEWLAGTDGSLKITTDVSGLGRVVDRAGNVSANTGVITILRRSDALGIGYRIHTSFVS